MIRNLLICCCAGLALAACSGSRGGVVIASDGTIIDNTPEYARDRAQRQIAAEVSAFLTPRTVTVAITPLPHWQTESRARAEGWYWDRARIELVTDAAVNSDETARMLAVAHRQLSGAVIGGRDACVVTVSAHARPVAAPADGTAGSRRYIVQSGDTLADISSVFYGTAQHWRAIIAANPGLDPGNLPIGRELVIPARP